MKSLGIGLATLALSSLMACSASIDATGDDIVEDRGGQKPIKNAALAGTVFGKSWKASSAGYQELEEGKLRVTVAPEGMDPCFSFGGTSQTYVYFQLPTDSEQKKFVTDLNSRQKKAPVVFAPNEETRIGNYEAHFSTVEIIKESPREMELGIFAQFTEYSERVSEINGRIKAINCDAQMTFQSWSQFAGSYLLTEFDGRELSYQEQQRGTVALDKSTYADKAGKFLSSLVFPLFYSVNEGSSTSIEIGPFEKLGTSWKEETPRGIKYRYVLDADLYDGSRAYPTELDLTIEDNGTNKLFVEYRVLIKGFVGEQKHTMVLEKTSY